MREDKTIKLYAIPVTLYVEACDEEKAAGVAELDVFAASEALRKANSGWVSDQVTTLVTSGIPTLAEKLPEEGYKKDILIKAFGEETSVRFLIHLVDKVHP
jgi:hypothetical protein